jgi:AcrR family transcriptional regulator
MAAKKVPAPRKRISNQALRDVASRDRILAAAEALLEEVGVAGMSMREVARRASLTHQAPYHHFDDKESILAALVEAGFATLATRMREALDVHASSPRSVQFVEAGLAYVGFAIEHPARFRMMFEPHVVDVRCFPAAQSAGDDAYDQLLRLVSHVEPAARQVHASLRWSVVHGLARLLVDGSLHGKSLTTAAKRAHARDVLVAFASTLSGMG